MQRVSLICVGKLKEKFYIDASGEYIKRLQRHCKFELIVKNIIYPEQQSDVALDQCAAPVEDPEACPCGCDCKVNEGCACEHCTCEADAVPECAQTENA